MGPDPLQYHVLASADEDELRDAGSRMFSPHRLRLGAGEARLGAVDLDELLIGRLRYGSDAVVATDPIHYYSVQLPITGRGGARVLDEAVTMRRGQGLVLNPGDAVAFELDRDLDRIALKIPEAVITRHLAILLGYPVGGPPRFRRSSESPRSPWVSALCLLAREVDPFGTRPVPRPLAGRVVDAFLTSLLLSQTHDWSARLHDALPSERSAVTSVVDRIEADPQLPWSLATLAAEAGVGGRSLQIAFRRELGVSPMRYLRNVRLRRCYAALRDPAFAGISVSDVAAANGFTHLGRFAQVFRDTYGLLPSEVRRSVR
ncbi:AraC family transcriptional regulator [Microbacterium sp. NPDC078428]|uniref:AraC family transcriptional regulator n=1 Tax=Microbacterium sp. NPDC078428 TaxID=3364190 RepID=UPI0037CBEDCA